jgi:uncharacterized membrane protein required for colicin V production
MAVEISYADFTIIALMIIFGFEGYRTGLFNGLLSIGGIFFALIITILMLPYSSRFFNYVIELPPNISILMGFISIFVLLLLLYELFLEWVHKIMKMEVVDWFNRISGTLLGLYKGLLSVSLLAIGFSLMPMKELVKSTEANSTFVIPVKYFTPFNYNFFRKLFPRSPSFEDALKNTFAQMQQPPDEMAQALIDEFNKRYLQKNVTTKR